LGWGGVVYSKREEKGKEGKNDDVIPQTILSARKTRKEKQKDFDITRERGSGWTKQKKVGGATCACHKKPRKKRGRGYVDLDLGDCKRGLRA